VSFGKEFNLKATPDQEMLRKLAYLAGSGTAALSIALRANPNDRLSVYADADFIVAMQMNIATEQQRDRYQEQLDAYLEALEIAEIEALNEREELLRRAYVLPDGTRIFFDKDGRNAIDENCETVDPARYAHVSMDDRKDHKIAELYQQNADRRASIRSLKDHVLNAKQATANDPNLTAADIALSDHAFKKSVNAAIQPYASAKHRFSEIKQHPSEHKLDIPEFDDDELALIERGLTSTPAPARSFNLASVPQIDLESPAQPPTPDPKDVPVLDLPQ